MSGLGIPPDYSRSRGLSFQVEAAELESIATKDEGRQVQVTPATARAWSRMREAAAAAGVTLVPHSGFRSIARQGEIIRAKLEAGETLAKILTVMTAPGYSEHHTGRAIDIGVPGQPPLTEEFAETPAFAWLQAHAGECGFSLSYPRNNIHGITYEPWHWFFIPLA